MCHICNLSMDTGIYYESTIALFELAGCFFLKVNIGPKQLQEGNADPALKPDFYIFLVIFQHK